MAEASGVGFTSHQLKGMGALTLALASAMGCSVGVGTGEVSGSVVVSDCETSETFALNPTFFAADDFEEQLTIRIQRGGDFAIDSDGISIVVVDATSEKSRLGTPLTLDGTSGSPVSMSLYLNASCPSTRDDIPVFLEATSGTITFDSLYAPEVSETQRECSGHFEDVTFEGPEGRTASLSGSFRFLFERGRPAQPFP